MRSILRSRPTTIASRHHPPSPLSPSSSSFDFTAAKFGRDRGLDHAVEREKFLRPVIDLKNLLKCEPSKSLPISVIAQNRDAIRIPIRPVDFLRRYPSVFEEFTPGNVGVHPHFKLTDEVLELDADEQLIFQSETYRQEAADRVLKLLMMSRVLELPLDVIDSLRWDIGLPADFAQGVVPEFPDYFRVVGREETQILELVCWSSDLARSVVEKRTGDCKNGKTVEFDMQFSKGFEMDKKLKKWTDEWQKLPYFSPYENESHLSPSSDESDKWVVAVLHELLHLFISKKAEREVVLHVGECLGIRSRFKRALLNHPGIFYVSSKNRTHTVVLKEAFKRGSLIEVHPLVDMRNRYVHLMNKVKEDKKVIASPASSNKQPKQASDNPKQQVEGENAEDDDAHSMSNSEIDDDGGDYDHEDDEEDDDAGKTRSGGRKKFSSRGNRLRKSDSYGRGHFRNHAGGNLAGERYSNSQKVSGRHSKIGVHKDDQVHGRLQDRSNF